MDEFWTRALNEAEQAEAQARTLRARFGDEAEERCRAELRNVPPDDPRRRRVEDVRRALRWT